MAGPGDDLFLALAKAKSLPSHAFRDTQAALEIPGEAVEGYSKGLQLKRMIQQPAANRRLYSAIGGPNADALTDSDFAGTEPKEILNYGIGANRVNAQKQLGMASIAERQHAAEINAGNFANRTKLYGDIFGGKNITENIAHRENEVNSLSKTNAELSKQLPSTLTASAINGAAGLLDLAPPQYKKTLAMMAQNQAIINEHKRMLPLLYKAQGMGGANAFAGMQADQMPGSGTNDGGDDWLTIHE